MVDQADLALDPAAEAEVRSLYHRKYDDEYGAERVADYLTGLTQTRLRALGDVHLEIYDGGDTAVSGRTIHPSHFVAHHRTHG